jgi:hypothetical protein
VYFVRIVYGHRDKESVGVFVRFFYYFNSTNVSRGAAYTITVTPSWANRKFKEGYAVWIDFNADGDLMMPENK